MNPRRFRTARLLHPAHRRRGSVFIIVVVILTVLALLGIAMSYSTRMELLASRNWANTIQSKTAAATGLPVFQSGSPREVGPLSQNSLGLELSNPLEPVRLNLELSEEDRRAMISGHAAVAQAQRADPGQVPPRLVRFISGADSLAEVDMQDTSALFNINAVAPVSEINMLGSIDQADNRRSPKSPVIVNVDMLARLIAGVAQARGVTLEVDPKKLALAIAARRMGPDMRPGQAGHDDNANGSQRAIEWAQKTAGLVEQQRMQGSPELAVSRPVVLALPEAPITEDGLDNDYDGQVDEGNEGVDEPGEIPTDMRVGPVGDDRPYHSLGELMSIPGMTPALYRALAPHLTVLSVSYAAFDLSQPLGNGAASNLGFPQVDPNTASPEQMMEVLHRRLPDAPKPLLAQFAVNLVDRRDEDQEPTKFAFENHDYHGFEINPVINEVCPDTSSFDEQGDDGQYIELHNPYSHTINLSGWKIRGAGPELSLQGSLPAGGYLVLTDDYNNQLDPTPEHAPGQGSFYNIFSVVPTGPHKRLEEYIQLDLINEFGEVKLINPRGREVDVFAYEDGRWTGAPKSFQRDDPRLRASLKAMASPLAPNRVLDSKSRLSQAIGIQENWQDQPFRGALETMLVSSAFYRPDPEGDGPRIHGAQLPVLNASRSDQLDVRIVDCFRIGAIIPKPLRNAHTPEPVRVSTIGARRDASGRQRRLNQPIEPPRCFVTHGRFNLNTASLGVLSTLPGMTRNLLARIHESRMLLDQLQLGYQNVALEGLNSEQAWEDRNPLLYPRWRNLSDFLLDEVIWAGRPLYDRLDTAYPFARLITTHSVSIQLNTTSRPAAPPDTLQRGRRPSVARAERILIGDRGVIEMIGFRYHRSHLTAFGDPDLRYSMPVAATAVQQFLTDQRLAPRPTGAVSTAMAARREVSINRTASTGPR